MLLRYRLPIGLLAFVGYFVGTVPGHLARAQSAEEEVVTDEVEPAPPAAKEAAPSRTGGDASTRKTPAARSAQPMSSPVGGDKTGVSTQAISLPKGSGTLQGMGESFSAQLSTGIASYSIPFSLLAARGGAQPSLSLSYGSGLGHGLAGAGWEVGWAFISRQTDRGIPKYADNTGWHPEQDHFVFGGGEELVPICVVSSGGGCTGAVAGEVMPAWAGGWAYFRPRVEGAYARFFLSPDKKTWRVQGKTDSMELGVPLDGSGYTGAVEGDPTNSAHVFRWNVVRSYDSHGSPNPAGSASPAPVNVVQYRYQTREGMAYLTDVYDSPPIANAASASLAAYAHHTKLVYEPRTDPTISFRRGYRTDQTQRLRRVDVASKTFSSASAARRLVRRYRLSYDPAYRVSLLTSVQLAGRCGAEWEAPAEDANQTVPDATGCATLPPLTFAYQHVSPFRPDGSPGTRDLPGHEGFDERWRAMTNSPKYYIEKNSVELFDINSDALPDVLVTEAEEFDHVYGVFFNGAGGRANNFGLSRMTLGAVGPDGYGNIRLSDLNIAVMDLDGDGTIDLLSMPQAQREYSVYSPQLRTGGWVLQGRRVTTADRQDVRLDWANSNDIRVLDANGDGLTDAVFTDGTGLRTFFSLARYPAGDSQYGRATWTSATTAAISNEPVAKCLPTDDGGSMFFADGTIRIGDLNGDGLQDIIRVNSSSIRYWPGRGDGMFGTGNLNCPEGTFPTGRQLLMANSPNFSVGSDSPRLRFEDVDSDGLDDLLELGDTEVNVWLNEGGVGFTNAHHIDLSSSPLLSNDYVRIADMNGSGSRDLFDGQGQRYRYIDFNGGVRPWVLTQVSNGLGKTTDIEYSTSTAMMLAAEAAGNPWTSKAPMPLQVVSKLTVRDNLQTVGRPAGAYVTEYVYRDAVYDGRQREFRGFRTTTVKKTGDANSPTSFEQSSFLLGECADDEPPPTGVSSRCAPAGRWMDNPREGLKGLPYLSEAFDEAGRYLSTTHTTYRLRKLYTGLDGRQVRAAFVAQTDSYAYDVAAFASSSAQVSLTDVELELTPGTVKADRTSSIALRSTAGRVRLRKATTVDLFGNATDAVDYGCIEGCPTVDETITSHSTPARRSDDTSGWQWRTVESYVTGSSNASAKRQHAHVQYDASGDPTQTTIELTGTLPLKRFHEDGNAVAPSPPGASVDGTIVVSSRQYDAFGNVTRITTPNHRCREMKPDTDFAMLPIGETVYVGTANGACGGTALTAYASYDRGISAPISAIGLHGELTSLTYDGFGRLTSMRKPSPTQLGASSAVDSVQVEYVLPANPVATPYTIMHTRTQDGATDADATYRDVWAFIDSLGRGIVTLEEADPNAEDGGQWVVKGAVSYDAKGALNRAYEPWFWTGDPKAFPLGTAPPTKFVQKAYDAFGRTVRGYALDKVFALRSDYHALSTDAWDAEDLGTGLHSGTFASERRDGHGRVVDAIERAHAGSGIEERHIQTAYLPTGEPTEIRRARGSDVVARTMQYDSLGRMVLNVEPNTSKGTNAWRYAFDDNGDLVGTSDARGCGTNYHYDAGGRILAEDYSPCLRSHADYSAPDLATGNGTEVHYHYDTADASEPTSIDDCTISGGLLLGRLASVSDRASKSLTSFDGRGRAKCVARRVAKPGPPSNVLQDRYAPGWYTQTVSYDGADRLTQASTGAKVAELRGANNASFVTTAYSGRGTVKSVGSSYGALVSTIRRDAVGAVLHIGYGDAAATKTDFTYDVRHRVSTVQTFRGPPALWSQSPPPYTPAPAPNGPPTSFQLSLENVSFGYDAVDNPTLIQDQRSEAEWPAGAKPVSRAMQYDDLYRLARIDYSYPSGSDTWTSPFASENGGTSAGPRRAKPGPHVGFDKRVLTQSFQYDWLGNTGSTTDDASGFYDRSLGTITNGTASAGPYQLKGASGGTAPRNGSLTTRYDDAGHLVGLSVVRNGAAPCLPTGESCSQRFAYDWDEVGRLAVARRWDGPNLGTASDPLPASSPDVELAYAYDGRDSRVLKTARSAEGERHTVYVFASLELRRAKWNETDYERTAWTEVPYLLANGVRLARLHYADTSVPTATNGQLHVLFELPDHLGSSSIVIDKATGELVERSTYQAYGAAESDYRPERWDAFREDYRFTGKEEDIEVGLLYFGKRYLAPALNRWVSPDPLAVHAPGQADLNLYAYVHGRVLQAVDPLGLAEDTKTSDPPPVSSKDIAAVVDEEFAKDDARCLCSSSSSGIGQRLGRPPAPTSSDSPGAFHMDLQRETVKWNPNARSSTHAMLLGSAQAMTFEQSHPQAARDVKIVSRLVISMTPAQAIFDVATLENPDASAGDKLLAMGNLMLTATGPLRALGGMVGGLARAELPALRMATANLIADERGFFAPGALLPGGGSGGPPKLFHNLFPEDTPKAVGMFTLEQQGGKWVTVSSSGDVFSASGRYTYVVKDGQITVGRNGAGLGSRPAAGHVDLAGGGPVEFAGEIQFSGSGNRGTLRWWNNGSGHYQPSADFAHQTGLPMDKFRPFE